MAAASPQKHLKIYNFGTTNVILMKHTTIIYLHETFHLAKNLGVTHKAFESGQKTFEKKPKNQFFGLISLNF